MIKGRTLVLCDQREDLGGQRDDLGNRREDLGDRREDLGDQRIKEGQSPLLPAGPRVERPDRAV